MRPSGRAPDQMRAIIMEPGFTRHAEGSCLVGFGDTRVLCTASVETNLPPWLRGKGKGWVRPNMACCRGRPTRAGGARRRRASSPVARRRSSG
jgi:ribonuclease PH